MTHLFFDQTFLESRGQLYVISFRADEGICYPSDQSGSCFCKVIALFRKRKSSH